MATILQNFFFKMIKRCRGLFNETQENINEESLNRSGLQSYTIICMYDCPHAYNIIYINEGGNS